MTEKPLSVLLNLDSCLIVLEGLKALMLIANAFRTNAENQGQNVGADVILPSVNAYVVLFSIHAPHGDLDYVFEITHYLFILHFENVFCKILYLQVRYLCTYFTCAKNTSFLVTFE